MRNTVDCLGGRAHPRHNCQRPETRVAFPLVNSPSTQWVHKYRGHWQQQLRGSALAHGRQRFLDVVADELEAAATLVNQDRPEGAIMDLHQPLKHLERALDSLSTVTDYDDTHSMLSSELPLKTPIPDSKSSENMWSWVKLGYTRVCLSLLVPILRLILPDREEYWIEAARSLQSPHWRKSFILDTDTSQHNSTISKGPRREDVLSPKIAKRVPSATRTCISRTPRRETARQSLAEYCKY